MKTKFLAIAMCCVLITFIVSCTDETSIQETNSSVETTQEAFKLSNIDNKSLEKMKYFKAKIRAGENVKEELIEFIFSQSNGSSPSIAEDSDYYNNLVRSVIDPNEYECNGFDVPFNNYINSTVVDWEGAEWFVYAFYLGGSRYGFHYGQIDAIYIKSPDDRQAYGVNGEYTNRINRVTKDLKRFWDIFSGDIGMVAMKGDTYSNYETMFLIEKVIYGASDEETKSWVDLVMGITASDSYWNNTHPLLSLNAFALSTTDPFIKDRIIMGDGISDAYTAIDMGDVAPQSILAHEYGHHIQFENGYFEEGERTPEGTRRTELMADAYSAYYLTHKRGATMNWWRVQQFLEVFYNIGDCGFSSPGHHGTYEQRLAAAQWGYDLANNSKVKGKILTSDAFFQLFEEDLDDIINCDTCLN